MSKTPKARIQQRTEEILRIILDGAESPWDTCAYVREKEAEPGSAWELSPGEKPLSDSQIRRYVAKATEMIAASCRASRKKLLRRHLAQRRNLYAKAVSQGDTRTALAILSDEAKLLGLYAPTKIAPTNPKGDQPYAPLTDEDRRAALAALYASVGSGDRDAHPDGADDADRSTLGGPDANLDGRGHDAGSLAGGPLAGDLEAGFAAMLTAGR